MSIDSDDMAALAPMIRREAIRAARVADDRQVVDDLMSEGWVAVLQDLGRLDLNRGVPLVPFMFKRVRGAMFNWLRWYWRKGVVQAPRGVAVCGESALAGRADGLIKPEQAAIASEGLDAVFAACRTERERALLLAIGEGYTEREVARTHQISQTRVSQIRRGIIERSEQSA